MLHLVTNQVMYNKLKHINIKYQFIKDALCDIKLEFLKMNDKINEIDAIYYILCYYAGIV